MSLFYDNLTLGIAFGQTEAWSASSTVCMRVCECVCVYVCVCVWGGVLRNLCERG